MINRTLLALAALRPGESLLSFLVRLAAENTYRHSPLQVLKLCRERLAEPDNPAQPNRAETYRVLAELVKVEAGELYAACPHYFASAVSPPAHKQISITLPSGRSVPLLSDTLIREHLWTETDLRFCPLCLRESAYHRLGWMPLAVSACLRHQTLLVHRCPNCRKRLQILDITKAACRGCGHHLADTPAISVSGGEFGLFSQAAIQHWLGAAPPPAGEYNLPKQPPAILYRLLDGLRRGVMTVERGWSYLPQPPFEMDCFFPCSAKSSLTPAKSYVLYATAFKGLVSWPLGFYCH